MTRLLEATNMTLIAELQLAIIAILLFISIPVIRYIGKRTKVAEKYEIILIYLIISVSVILIAVKTGPILFQALNFTVTDSNSITASDSINYFLETFLAVVIGGLPINMANAEKNKGTDSKIQN